MKALKIAGITLALYVTLVAGFESLFGFLQPTSDQTLVITTFDADGTTHDRVLGHLESEGKLYVAVNHWPRAWYRRALAHPEVQAVIAGKRGDYRAVPVSDAEHERVNGEHLLGAIRILTGFAPRHFLRLDPR